MRRAWRSPFRRSVVRPSVLVCALALAGLSGCQRWQVDQHALISPHPDRQRLQIWTREGPMLVHGVRASWDSVRAVPYWKDPACDSCAVHVARSAVDSVRVQVTDDVRSGIAVGIGVLGLVLLGMLFRDLQSLKD